MSYADGLLSTGESILVRNKQHPFIFIWGARYTILAIVISALVFLFTSGMDPNGLSGSVHWVLSWITAILFFGGIVVAIWTALRYLNQEYVLTNRRVIRVEGVLNRSSTDSSLEKINDAVLSQSIFGRMLDFGDLTVLTASETGIDKMKMLRRPVAFKKAMLDAKHEFEIDMERAGWAPGPPIRDGATGAPATRVDAATTTTGTASVPAAIAASAAAPPAQAPVDPDEVTRTLANLADLRDRGAITPEEYEAKKTDLLSRL